MNQIEYVGKVKIDDTFYPGEDLYLDGSEERLLEIVKNHPKDRYNQKIWECQDWAILYHLSDIRGNIVDALPITKSDKVLEIGAGCGAVTGILAKKAQAVDCVELSKKRSLVNATRNQEYDNIRILVGNFQDIEPTLDDSYDYITLVGVLEYAASYIAGDNPYVRFLEIIRKHLKAGGTLVVAIENQYGLKYFAGCKEDHVGRYFAGMEGYTIHDRVRTFSKSGLEKLSKESGFSEIEFFYPYPDYKLPLAIYSDEHLPRKGELTDNERNFDNERMVLFDEANAFDALLSDGMFDLFSNSYLVLMSDGKADDSADKVIATRYGNDRNKKYKSKTSLHEIDGLSYVYKQAMTEDCKTRLMNEMPLYSHMETLLKKSVFALPPEIEEEEDGFRFRYADGTRLSEQLSDFLQAGYIEAFRTLLKKYKEGLCDLAKEEFAPSETYFEIFGANAYQGEGKSIPVTCLDLTPENLLYGEDRWQLCDLEWVFDFSVPVAFLLYHAAASFVGDGVVSLGEIDIYKELEIAEDTVAIYREMEESFRAYITRDNRTLQELYQTIGKHNYNPIEMMDRQNALQQQETELQALRSENDSLKEQRDQLQAEVDGFLNSKSWKLTEPLRAMRRGRKK